MSKIKNLKQPSSYVACSQTICLTLLSSVHQIFKYSGLFTFHVIPQNFPYNFYHIGSENLNSHRLACHTLIPGSVVWRYACAMHSQLQFALRCNA
jgi:hypothetical protein